MRAIPFAELALSRDWVKPDLRLVVSRHRDKFENQCGALAAFLQGATIRQAARRYGVNRNTLTTIVRKAFLMAPDGTSFGYRACIPWIGKAESRVPRQTSGENAPYVLMNLLQDNPDIERMLSEFKDPLPHGRTPRSFMRTLQRVRATLRERGYSDRWPFTTTDLGRRAFLRYVRKIRRQRLERGQAEVRSPTEPLIKSLRQLFHPQPYDRFEFDAHRKDVELIIELPNSKGELVKYSISCVWILVVIDVNSTAVLAHKIVFGKAYSALDVAQCFAMAASKWQRRELVAPDMVYVPGASMPQDLDWGCMSAAVTAMDNALAHTATFSLESWVNYNDGIFHFGPAHTPEHRPYIELFFARLEAGAIRDLPGGFEPSRTLGVAAEPTSGKKARNHPVSIRALEDLFDVLITGHNVSPIPARQQRSPMEILREHEFSDHFWRFPTRTSADVKALTSHQRRVRIRGSKTNDKPIHINVYGVTYRHPELDKQWDLVGSEFWACIDLEDLRTAVLQDNKFNHIATLVAASPWDTHKHDITTRRRILKLSRSGELEIVGAQSAVSAYAAYTLQTAGRNRASADQAARLLQLAINEHIVTTPPSGNDSQDDVIDSQQRPSRFNNPIGGRISF